MISRDNDLNLFIDAEVNRPKRISFSMSTNSDRVIRIRGNKIVEELTLILLTENFSEIVSMLLDRFTPFFRFKRKLWITAFHDRRELEEIARHDDLMKDLAKKEASNDKTHLNATKRLRPLPEDATNAD